MAKTFRVKVITPIGVNFEDDVIQVELRTKNGYVGILANHQPIVGSCIPSICYFRDAQGERLSVLINSAIFKMDGNELLISTDFFFFTKKIDDNTFKLYQDRFYQALDKNVAKDSEIYKELEVDFIKEMDKLKSLIRK